MQVLAGRGKDHLYFKESKNNGSWPLAHPVFVFLCLSAYFCFLMTALGVTAGAHRLWSHRSYKAKLPLRIFLAAANSMAFQVGLWLPIQILGLQAAFSPVQGSPQLTDSKRKKKKSIGRKTFADNTLFWLRGRRTPLSTHVAVCIRESRSNNYLRTNLNVPRSTAQHPISLSMVQVRSHTSQDNVETFARTNLMQICLCNQVSLSFQAVGDFDVPRKKTRLPFSILIF